MASGLYNLQASVSRNLTRCLKHSSDISSFGKSRWRSVTSLSFNPSLVDDSCEAEVRHPSLINKPAELLSLKEKERGDWRNLTVEEKQALYHMSFNQPFHIFEQPADEWKLILAGTFTAMGLMTLGMYMWMSRFEQPETITGPLSHKNELKDKKEISLFYGNEIAKAG